MADGPGEKIDAIDLIINALKDHEKKLDDISHHFEELLNSISTEKIVGGRANVQEKPEEPAKFKRKLSVVCSKWSEFKEICVTANMVAFEIENKNFNVYALINDEIYKYSENMPSKRLKVTEEQSSISIDKSSLNNIEMFQFLIDGKLACGLKVLITGSRTLLSGKQYAFDLSYGLNSAEAKDFLSDELNVLKDRIVEGKITD